MALPTILFNSSTGSDTQASGAGPATALFGTTDASTDGAGTTITLTAGTDLSGVATDGSAVIFLNDSTAGARNFGKIIAVNDGADTVTVSDAFGLSLSGKSWAIGGKRLTLAGTTSLKLVSNNSAAGDAMPGWTLQMDSGYTETLTATYTMRRAGDSTSGPITLKGILGAATPPVLTFTNNASAITASPVSLVFMNFTLQNSNATKTASIGMTVSGSVHINNVRITSAANKFWKAISAGGRANIRNCDIGNTASHGIEIASASLGIDITGNYIHSCAGNGINLVNGTNSGIRISNNIIYSNTLDGISLSSTATTNKLSAIISNTIDSNGSDGIELTTDTAVNEGVLISNNILTNNTGFGLNFSHANHTTANLNGRGIIVAYNNTFGNGTAAYNPAGYGTNDPALNPTYTNAAAGDFRINELLKAKGYPDATMNIGNGTTDTGGATGSLSYVDIGAVQRLEPISTIYIS